MVTWGSHTVFFFFNDPATTEIYTLSLHDALPISPPTISPENPGRFTRCRPASPRTAGDHSSRAASGSGGSARSRTGPFWYYPYVPQNVPQIPVPPTGAHVRTGRFPCQSSVKVTTLARRHRTTRRVSFDRWPHGRDAPSIELLRTRLARVAGGSRKRVAKALAAVTLAALLPMAPPVEAAQPPALLASWSTGDIPTGLAIGPDGKVYVGGQDGGSALVRVFLQDGTPTGLIGAGNGQEAYGLAFLSDGRLLVAEYYRHVVDQFAPDGTNLGSWAVPGSNDLFLAVDGTDRKSVV